MLIVRFAGCAFPRDEQNGLRLFLGSTICAWQLAPRMLYKSDNGEGNITKYVTDKVSKHRLISPNEKYLRRERHRLVFVPAIVLKTALLTQAP